MAIDGKTSRRSGKVDGTALHLVSAFAAGAGLVLGQRATAEKSNEKTAIPELLATLALQGCTVTIDAMGTQANIAQAIRDGGADYVLAVKTTSPSWLLRSRTSGAASRPIRPPTPGIALPKAWKRTMAVSRHAVARSSTTCSACISPNSGLT
ncbi:hypothetical protein HDF15_001366 [Granulicella mallensis]|uniref:Transposase IS4-like domain-containing protein n=1 Tax=Granulicella mallensis TaxID=940614 RepID=A0A7W7ZPS7_9BACT|nr:hypothetical protein [Granulicella mallensis]